MTESELSKYPFEQLTFIDRPFNYHKDGEKILVNAAGEICTFFLKDLPGGRANNSCAQCIWSIHEPANDLKCILSEGSKHHSSAINYIEQYYPEILI